MMNDSDDEVAGPKMMRTEDGDTFNPDGFVAWVQQYKHNSFGIELSEALMQIRDATMLYGRASSMTIKIKVGPDEHLDEPLLVWTDVETKPARPKPKPEHFYPTGDGSLSRRSPSQPQMPGMEEI